MRINRVVARSWYQILQLRFSLRSQQLNGVSAVDSRRVPNDKRHVSDRASRGLERDVKSPNSRRSRGVLVVEATTARCLLKRNVLSAVGGGT